MSRTPEDAWSFPWDAPLVPSFPFTFRDVEVMTLAYRTDPMAAAALLPPPLRPVGDVVLIHIYRMGDVEWLGSYGEANVMIGAELPGKARGGFSPYLFLDSDVGLAHGREVHGQPKKLAKPSLRVRKDLVVGKVRRNGIDVVTGTMAYKQQRGELATLKALAYDFSVNLNYKVIPHIDGRPAVRQLTSRTLGGREGARVLDRPVYGGAAGPTRRRRSIACRCARCSTATTGAPSSRSSPDRSSTTTSTLPAVRRRRTPPAVAPRKDRMPEQTPARPLSVFVTDYSFRQHRSRAGGAGGLHGA
jgi:acetoacetate decarboxylase